MPNPFDLRGPEFLVLYIVLGTLVTFGVVAYRRQSEPTAAVAGPLTDYLRIAYLRGGAEEALRIAVLALIDRGLITVVEDEKLKAAYPQVPAGLQRTEERLLDSCKDAIAAHEILSDASLKVTVTAECELQLIRAGLLPDAELKSRRELSLVLAWLFMGVVAAWKVLVALGRGRTNVWLLIVACAVFMFVLSRLANPFRTLAGESMLADLRTLFSALRDRAASISINTGNNDLPLLAAVFGVHSLPGSSSSIARKLFRKPGSPFGSSSSSGCGSGGSCGSASCGGGCGGGCGGCGGG